MAFKVVKSADGGPFYEGQKKSAEAVDIVLDSVSDLDSIPAGYRPGSVAYTADLANVYVLSPSGNWTEV